MHFLLQKFLNSLQILLEISKIYYENDSKKESISKYFKIFKVQFSKI